MRKFEKKSLDQNKEGRAGICTITPSNVATMYKGSRIVVVGSATAHSYDYRVKVK